MAQQSPHPLRMAFRPELEAEFQQQNYARSRGFIRGAALIFLLMGFVHAVRFASTQPIEFLAMPVLVMLFWCGIFALTVWRDFWRYWQPVLTCFLLVGISLLEAGAAYNIALEPGYEDLIARVSWFSAACMMFMVALAPLRLSFFYSLAVYVGVGVQCAVICYGYYGAPWMVILDRFSLGVLIAVPTLSYLAYVQERLQRETFLSNHLLQLKEQEERQRRIQSETMLKVLSNAIGGIVHDLGNPLAAVETGVQVLELALQKQKATPDLVSQVAQGIRSGTSLLGHLRVSLIEQTRVLEGKPIPVQPSLVSVGYLVDAGIRFQKPMFSARRVIRTDGKDLQVHADAMKMAAVFMNLIGNALKYSDGEVLVSWGRRAGTLFMAVQDQGQGGRGIGRDQCDRLFVPFGRLDNHAHIEGTGLGLLSVLKIVEAHGGSVAVEGRNALGGTFSTAEDGQPFALWPGFMTAFVVLLPCEGGEGLAHLTEADTPGGEGDGTFGGPDAHPHGGRGEPGGLGPVPGLQPEPAYCTARNAAGARVARDFSSQTG